jgi:hypothetical protein
MAYNQKSKRKSGSSSNKNESYMFDDIQYIFSELGTNQNSIFANGFKVTSAINSDITLPAGNATLTYQGPLTMGAGYTLNIPSGTTLTIL